MIPGHLIGKESHRAGVSGNGPDSSSGWKVRGQSGQKGLYRPVEVALSDTATVTYLKDVQQLEVYHLDQPRVFDETRTEVLCYP